MITLNANETIFLLACKGWEIEDKNFYYQETVDVIKNWNVEDFIKMYPLTEKSEFLKLKNRNDIRIVSEYTPILKVYIALFGNDIGYETHNAIVSFLSDIAFKINPEGFKKAITETHSGSPFSTTLNILASIRSVITHSNIQNLELDLKYAPEKFLLKYPKEKTNS